MGHIDINALFLCAQAHKGGNTTWFKASVSGFLHFQELTSKFTWAYKNYFPLHKELNINNTNVPKSKAIPLKCDSKTVLLLFSWYAYIIPKFHFASFQRKHVPIS